MVNKMYNIYKTNNRWTVNRVINKEAICIASFTTEAEAVAFLGKYLDDTEFNNSINRISDFINI